LAGEWDGRICRRVTSGCRRLPGRTTKPAAVRSTRLTAMADTAVGGAIRAAVEFLVAAVAARRPLVGRPKPVASGTRRSNGTTSTAAVDGTRGTGTDLRTATCGRRRAVKVKDLKSPADTVAVASLHIASLHRGGTGCRRAGSVPISPAALGHFARICGRRVAKPVVKPASTLHAKTTRGRQQVTHFVQPAATQDPTSTGGRRVEDPPRPATLGRSATIGSHLHLPAAADRFAPAATRHLLPVPATLRPTRTDKCRRLLPIQCKPAVAYHQPPAPAAKRAAPTDKCRRQLLHPRLPAAAHRFVPSAARPRPPVPAATRPAPSYKGRWLLLRPHSLSAADCLDPAATRHWPPELAATSPAVMGQRLRLLPNRC